MSILHRPPARGLYRPEFEHDACGVGFIVDMKGRASHRTIRDGLTILRNLEHRGACGCEANTGDGAGLTMQIPHAFLQAVCADGGIDLPDAGAYAVSMTFLPRDEAQRRHCESVLEDAVAQTGQRVLGWRDVPVDADAADIGATARAREPAIRQLIIGKGDGVGDTAAFERKLYVIRKIAENAVWNSDLSEREFFYIPSLSSRTICYKGQLLAPQIDRYFPDLRDERAETALALVHQRYSTNTFPSWDLAQPFRYLCHNGEINTLRGNTNWMKAREMLFASDLFGKDIEKLRPIIREGASDSACFDNCLELLVQTGRSLPHAMMMMIPEAWEHHRTMPQYKKDFYAYHLSLMEPWDGPASIAFTDGTVIGAVLDRNGLRPSRYVVTADDRVIMASEVGVLSVDPKDIVQKGRLQPGRMFLVDMSRGRIVGDEELKDEICRRRPYGQWLTGNKVTLRDLAAPSEAPGLLEGDDLLRQQQMFGYSREDLDVIIGPMADEGKEPIGSMGDDIPLAVLSDLPRLLYDYFKQMFAQVTNPPLDAIREELVTALRVTLGAEQDLFDETPLHCRHLVLDRPILTDEQLARIKAMDLPGLKPAVLSTLVDVDGGEDGLREALDALCAAASKAIDDEATVLILSDRGADATRMPIPALLVCGAVHHHLIREGARTRVGLIVESGEPREVQHFAVLCGYGAGGINPYVAMATLKDLCRRGYLRDEIDEAEAIARYMTAADKGILKIMSKMGISTLQSYRGAQIFEAIGLRSDLVDRHFTWTPSRIQGIGLDTIAAETAQRHARAHPQRPLSASLRLPTGGLYHWRRDGERHLFNPETVALLQQAAQSNDWEIYQRYAAKVNDQQRHLCTLRGLLEFREDDEGGVPLDEVEPAAQIAKRFKTGAMSYGSISREAHETLAIAMNRIGGKSNSGEGGEDPDRYEPLPNGDSRSSAIKQVASGRFGVTSLYLVNSQELQIKMAQGAKPGEGGQLPGYKVWDWIAKVRHSTPGVGLISPPPHHDIYSIEDLAQLIYDLKNANVHARVNVKLVSEVGVGTIAAGVSKGHADVVLISGHDGGTGASPISSVKHAGLPWELGIAETQQTLVINDLRGRIVVEADGQMKTGRDIAVATLLGAEEYGFATAALVVEGCIMLRKCHLDTCSVGIATQRPELRARYRGKPEHVVNYMLFVAEEMRRIMAKLGFRTVNEMVGRCDRLQTSAFIDHWKARGLDLSALLVRPDVPDRIKTYCCEPQDHGVDRCFDTTTLLKVCAPAIEEGRPVEAEYEVRNTMRTVGTITGSELTRHHPGGLPDDTVRLTFRGSAGQSFAAFCPRGMTFRLIGDANDYFGKGLSGARVIVHPPAEATFAPEENVIIGNVAFYGATGGEAFIRGMAGERFCVRNSGVHTVVEGIGDHGCEYMTGGRVVVIGPTGRNFAAGMSGGLAYVLDEDGDFDVRCNPEMVDLEDVADNAESEWLRGFIQQHVDATGSGPGRRVLENWDELRDRFVKVFPRDYKRVLREQAEKAQDQTRAVAAASD